MNIQLSAVHQRHRVHTRLNQTLSIRGQDCIHSTQDCTAAVSTEQEEKKRQRGMVAAESVVLPGAGSGEVREGLPGSG